MDMALEAGGLSAIERALDHLETHCSLTVAAVVVGVAALLLFKAQPTSDYRAPMCAVVTLSGVALAIRASGPLSPGERPPWVMNPSGLLTWTTFFFFLFASVLGKEMMNRTVDLFCRYVMQLPKMPTEGTGKLETLQAVDYCYIALNTFNDFLVFQYIICFCLGPRVEQRLGGFSALNGPVAFVVTLLCQDCFYWFAHAGLHIRAIYPYIHKQHHRQFMPFRGVVDATNVHPLEEMCGSLCMISSLHIVAVTIGIHTSAAWVAFGSWMFFNIGNHFDFDSAVHLPLPYPSLPRDHQMHHRIPHCNYGKLTTCFDRFFGTYRGYQPLGERGDEHRDAKGPSGGNGGAGWLSRSLEVLPSPWAMLPPMLVEIIIAVLVEFGRQQALPSAMDMAVLFRAPIFFTLSISFLCVYSHGLVTPIVRRKCPVSGAGNSDEPGAENALRRRFTSAPPVVCSEDTG